MKIKTDRFGELEIRKEDILNFATGLLAFEHLHNFILVEVAENPVFKWLQSTEDSEIAFLVVDPFVIKGDYSVYLSENIRTELEITAEEDVIIYTIVSVPLGGLKDATTNLMGPLVLNAKAHKGKQIVLENKELTIKYPLFPKVETKKVCGG
ncbi:flagellar assembly factor FliW [Desulfonispora thiosulfatigenes DSM 11270]|uniref:Flagellar assembly factor FliW n=1 Tax=Desulfonispora thiosulfatigenes DSM 11270 TaxID=656914 RepID=A0A1W1UPQ6_DESTI|nr:flagellar assembly protein FliW [Desulfonispora thiosulfatigenes]SMB82801.1 flagellar assembly factor FliW [Desulfonispora thiosulfatigenes DSM 11270]